MLTDDVRFYVESVRNNLKDSDGNLKENQDIDDIKNLLNTILWIDKDYTDAEYEKICSYECKNAILTNFKTDEHTFLKYADNVREMAMEEPWVDLYWELLKFESKYILDSFMLYMEKKRPFVKKFYQPRRRTLRIVVDDLQDLDDGKMKFYGLSMPSRVGKSTTCIFFLAWVMLKRPNSHSAMGGHSGILAKGFYKELMNLINTEEYAFAELFEYIHPKHTMLRDKSADEFTITLDQPDRFATITCRGIDGTWTGAVDVSKDGYLYVDDLVRDREHSLSHQRMESTYQEYLNKMVDRKNDGAKELMVGTLWNVMDPLNRIKEEHGNDPDYRFRKIPALDENNESNFQYEVNGFSTEYYLDMREKLDDPEWMAKFMQSPYLREGVVFSVDTLRTWNGVLERNRKYEITAVCDPAFGGGDSVSMPIGLKDIETNLTYVIAWIFDKNGVDVTIPRVSNALVKYGIKNITIEKNNGGGIFGDKIKEKITEIGYTCYVECIPAPNNCSKKDKILAEEDSIKKNLVFLDTSKKNLQDYDENEFMIFNRDSDYQAAIDELPTFVRVGKEAHDDAADGIAQLSIKIYGNNKIRTAKIISSPCW